jgi:hypothetical protein
VRFGCFGFLRSQQLQPRSGPDLALPFNAARPVWLPAQPAPAFPPAAEQDTSVISFKNIPHALATFFKAAASAAKRAEAVIEKVEADKPEIEAVSSIAASAIAPGSAPAVITIEDAGFAALGALDHALKAGGSAAEKKLLDAGLDQAAIDAVKQVGQQSVAVYTLVEGR